MTGLTGACANHNIRDPEVLLIGIPRRPDPGQPHNPYLGIYVLIHFKIFSALGVPRARIFLQLEEPWEP